MGHGHGPAARSIVSPTAHFADSIFSLFPKPQTGRPNGAKLILFENAGIERKRVVDTVLTRRAVSCGGVMVSAT